MEGNGFSLRDRVAVVTGGGQSLGCAPTLCTPQPPTGSGRYNRAYSDSDQRKRPGNLRADKGYDYPRCREALRRSDTVAPEEPRSPGRYSEGGVGDPVEPLQEQNPLAGRELVPRLG